MGKTNSKVNENHEKGNFLWEVKGCNAKMYLKGTVHLLPKSFFPLKDEIMNSFDKCNNLVLEIILPEVELSSIKVTNDIVFNREYTYEDGDSLYNHFPKEKVIELRNYLVDNKLCSTDIAKRFYKLRPEAVEAVIIDGINNKTGFDEKHIGVDYFFMLRAKAMKKKILELETTEFQDELLSKWESNTSEGRRQKKLNSFVEAFQMQDISRLLQGGLSRFISLKMIPWTEGLMMKATGVLYESEEVLLKERKKSMANKNPLLGNRDEKMTEKIERLLLNKDSYFVAVGAMHLLGEGSIVDRLQKKGYEVVRIC